MIGSNTNSNTERVFFKSGTKICLKGNRLWACLVLSVIALSCSSTPPVGTEGTLAPSKAGKVLGASKETSNLTAEHKNLAQEVEEEVVIGKALAAKLFGTIGSYDRDPALLKYLNLVGSNLAFQMGRPEIKFYFGILDTEEQNAFALPGGYILVTKGLLKKLQSESELANVLAHEIAHINLRHMYKDIKPKRTVSGTESLVRILSRGKSDISSSLTQAINKGMTLLLETGISHNLEYEADEVGILYAYQAGYNANDLGVVLGRLEKEHIGGMMSKTHPAFGERIKKLDFIIEQNQIPKILRARGEVLQNRFETSQAKIVK